MMIYIDMKEKKKINFDVDENIRMINWQLLAELCMQNITDEYRDG